jgi:hypothetical protein
MQTKPLQISIPKPCSQNFAEMPKQGDGMYCGQCTKIVYDFSMMTDYELLNFFKTKPDVHCGRFHNSQLNRKIEPVVVKHKLLHKISVIAASVLALIVLKPSAAKAQGVVRHVERQTDKATKNTTTIRDSINIKGVVKNEKNEPLQNVLIKMDGVGEIKTDADGMYDFGIINVENAHNIYYSCPNYVPVVRSYNAVMGSTIMDIVMGHRDSNALLIDDAHTIKGGISFYETEIIPFPIKLFKGKLMLSKNCKTTLGDVAYKLKLNPNAYAEIITYVADREDYKNAVKRIEEIKKYLVNKEGILADRVSTDVKIDSAKLGVVEIISQNY